MIEVDRLTRKYNSFTAVSDLSFRVEPGEVLGLVGLPVEGAIGIFWLGLLFDKFDPSDSVPKS